MGEKLVLVIENSRFKIQDLENIKFFISNIKFEKAFHKPKEIIFVDEIPRTPNGKVNRLELKKMIENR